MDLPINEKSQEFEDEGFQDGYNLALYLESKPCLHGNGVGVCHIICTDCLEAAINAIEDPSV